MTSDDLVRIVVMFGGGVTLGLLVPAVRAQVEVFRLSRAAVLEIAVLRVAQALSIIYIEFDIASRIGHDLTWRSVLSSTIVVLLALGLSLLIVEHQRIQRRGHGRRSTDPPYSPS